MPPFTWQIAAEMLFKYGPSFFTLAQKITANLAAGKANQQVSPADLAELDRLSSLTGEGIYAKLGITPPPPAQ